MLDQLDQNKIVDTINKFELYSERHLTKNKDLQKMTFEDISQEVTRIESELQQKNKKFEVNEFQKLVESAKNRTDICEIVDLTEDRMILVPFSFEAANLFGSYAGYNSWCIAKGQVEWMCYVMAGTIFYYVLYKNIPKEFKNKQMNPFFKLCVVCSDDGRQDVFNYFNKFTRHERLETDLQEKAKLFDTFYTYKNADKIIAKNPGTFKQLFKDSRDFDQKMYEFLSKKKELFIHAKDEDD